MLQFRYLIFCDISAPYRQLSTNLVSFAALFYATNAALFYATKLSGMCLDAQGC
jgi:hypothetical protein